MINDAKHIAAARALLGWSQQDLAEKSGVSSSAIKNIENGNTPLQKTQSETLPNIEGAFATEGVRFTQIGVEKPPVSHFKAKEYYGPNWWRDIVRDVLDTIVQVEDKTIWLFNSTPSETPDDILELWEAIDRAGADVRAFIEEGNTYYRGKQHEYRWTPKEAFKLNTLTMVYGNNVVITFEENKGGVVIESPDLADSTRRLYQNLWNAWPKPAASTYRPD